MNQQSSARSRRGVYSISVAAELSGIPVQSLRLYEQRGLLTPARTAGGTRRYSDDDLVRLQRITELLSDGVNVAGIGQILQLQDRNTQLETHNTELRTANTQLKSDNARLASDDRRGKARQGRSQAKKGTPSNQLSGRAVGARR
ncbi:MAG TPA: MerR family transcriptional regulator [Mycobacterium sp.]|nr:MerR family transcriptional regulator [Mycobacterium sp.]